MKKHIITSFLFLLANCLAFAQEAKQSFSLDEAIQYAIENSTSVKNAILDVKIAEGKVKEVTADGIPQVNGQIQLSDNPKVQTQFIPDFISPSVYGVLKQEQLINENTLTPEPEVFGAAFATQYSANASLTVKQLLFDGTFFLGLKAARTYKELSTKALTQTKTEAAVTITKAYYAVLIAEERLKLVNQNFTRVETLLSQTKTMYENGFAEKIEVSRIQVTYNNLVSQKKATENGILLSKHLLKYQMGFDVKQDIKLTNTLSEVILGNPPQDIPKDFDYKDRIEYSLMETQEVANQLMVKQYKVGYYPTIYANGNIGYNAGSNNFSDIANVGGDNWFQFSNIGVTISIPVFDGFRKKYQIQQAKLDLEKTQNNMTDLIKSIDFEQRQAKLNLQSNLLELENQSKNLELSKEIYEVSKVKYQNGVGSSLEVTDAETSLKESETNYYNALFNTLISKVDYDKAAGKISVQ